eukprot:COSAG05_NODE_2728_length_2712_cov_2.977507_3_plen_269_part_00
MSAPLRCGCTAQCMGRGPTMAGSAGLLGSAAASSARHHRRAAAEIAAQIGARSRHLNLSRADGSGRAGMACSISGVGTMLPGSSILGRAFASAASSSSGPAAGEQQLDAADDRFGGKVIGIESVLACASAEAFSTALSHSLATWKAQGTRGIWLSIPVARTELMPAAISQGFALHHTEPDRIVLNAWLSPDENLMPGYTTHTMGIGAVVINSERQILAMQEATGPASQKSTGNEYWKYVSWTLQANHCFHQPIAGPSLDRDLVQPCVW